MSLSNHLIYARRAIWYGDPIATVNYGCTGTLRISTFPAAYDSFTFYPDGSRPAITCTRKEVYLKPEDLTRDLRSANR